MLLLMLSAPLFGFPRAAAATRECGEYLISMADGVRIYSNISMLSPGRHPTIVQLSAYQNTACPTTAPNLSQNLVDQFNLAVVSLRGSGSSEGLYDMYGPKTQNDISAILDWLAKQPWSDGKLVLTGFSGTALAEVYGLGNKHVVAAVVGSSCSELYEWCLRQGGVLQWQGSLNLFGGTLPANLNGMPARMRLGLVNPDPAAQLAAIAQAEVDEVSRETRDSWWKQRSGFSRLGKTNTPVLYMTDNFDIINSAQYSAYARTRGPAFLTMAWGHAINGKYLVTPAREGWQKLVQNPIDDWVRHYVFGKPLDTTNRVTVQTSLGGYRSFNQPAGASPSTLDVIRQEKRWPLPSTRWQRIYLATGPSGSASSLNDGTLTTALPKATGQDSTPMATESSPMGVRRGIALVFGTPSVGVPADQLQHEENAALTYTTPPMRRNLEVTGPVVLRIFASTNASDFDWSVILTDVYPNGDSIYVSDGVLRASLRRVDSKQSMKNPNGEKIWLWYPSEEKQPVPADKLVEYEIQLQPISNVFQAGHRIRLDLFPLYGHLDSARTNGAGTLNVAYGSDHPSQLLLPVIPDRCHLGQPIDGGPRPARCATSLQAALGQTQGGKSLMETQKPGEKGTSVRGTKELAGTGLTRASVYGAVILFCGAAFLVLWRRKTRVRG